MQVGEMIALIAQSGGLLGLSIFAIWMLNKGWEARLAEEKRHSAVESQTRQQMQDALNRNTEVMTRLCERLDK